MDNQTETENVKAVGRPVHVVEKINDSPENIKKKYS